MRFVRTPAWKRVTTPKASSFWWWAQASNSRLQLHYSTKQPSKFPSTTAWPPYQRSDGLLKSLKLRGPSSSELDCPLTASFLYIFFLAGSGVRGRWKKPHKIKPISHAKECRLVSSPLCQGPASTRVHERTRRHSRACCQASLFDGTYTCCIDCTKGTDSWRADRWTWYSSMDVYLNTLHVGLTCLHQL